MAASIGDRSEVAPTASGVESMAPTTCDQAPMIASPIATGSGGGDGATTATMNGAVEAKGARCARGSSPSSFKIGGAATPVAGPSSATRRYERGGEIARGGLGRVMSALDRTLQRQVAIKELHHRTEHGARRFAREGLTTARLQHPAIVPVFDAGTWESGDPYLVMKLLEGKTISEELKQRSTTAARIALVPNLLAIADALGYAHEHGVVHRDVKPSNIMIGTHGETVLLDWGIAYDESAIELETEGLGRGPEPSGDHESADPLTVAGSVAGTLRYMSPEQARGECPTPAFDVYSLGATIATVLAGTRPFVGIDQKAMIDRLRAGRGEVPPLPTDIPADLAAIVAKATAPASERYKDAGQVAADLRKFIAGQLVSAKQYTWGELASRWIRRYRLSIAIAGVALATIIAVGVIAIRSVVTERNLAVEQRTAAETREHELVLLQARSNLRVDPTATVAWLKQYPPNGQRQDEVLAMLDEAAGRGVARHVWVPSSQARDATFLDGGALVAGHLDGTISRLDTHTGAQQTLATLPRSLVFVRAHGESAIVALDQGGGVHRWSDAGVSHLGSVTIPSRATGMFFVPGTDDVKLTFVDDEAWFMTASRPGQPHHRPVSKLIDDSDFADDENNAAQTYAVTLDGELWVADSSERKLHEFAPRTWVRSSDDGQRYLAIEPISETMIGLWAGSASGEPPIRFATTRPCAPGEDREETAAIGNDGRFAAIRRCGVLSIYDVRAKRTILVNGDERVGKLALSPDERWLALGYSNGVDLVRLETGELRLLAGPASIAFSRSGDWYATFGEQGIRLWSREHAAPAASTPLGAAGTAPTPTRLYVPTRTSANADEVLVRQHFQCSTWKLADRTRLEGFGVPPTAVDLLDDEPLLWPWDSSEDGSACIFAAANGKAIVGRRDGSRRLQYESELTECVLDAGALSAVCRTDDRSIVTFDLRTEEPAVVRAVGATPIDIARYRGAPVVLVEHGSECALETTIGARLAKLPAGCRSLRASNAGQLGGESALIIGRSGVVDVWSEELGKVVTLPAESGIVEVSRELDLAAIARGQAVEIVDVRTGVARAQLQHAMGVTALAWSSTGLLASADDETVRLWDPQTRRTRVIYVEQVTSLVWSPDGRWLVTTDGRVIQRWPVDMNRGTSPADVRARMEELTSARIVDGRVMTPR